MGYNEIPNEELRRKRRGFFEWKLFRKSQPRERTMLKKVFLHEKVFYERKRYRRASRQGLR